MMIEIFDLSGRCLQKNKLKIENHKGNFNIDLMNGAYIIKVTDGSHEKEIRKLLIAR